MTDRPIIFSGPMVSALIEGRKTQTRRLAWTWRKPSIRFPEGYRAATVWQGVKPGDRLWVRENFSGEHCWQDIPPSGWGWDTMQRPTEFWYWADGNPTDGDWTKPLPSIHMPRWASRLTIIVTATKMEPVQSISVLDVRAEGCEVRQFALFGADGPERQKIASGVYRKLWSDLHGPESWDTNPEVVAISGRVIMANIDSEKAKAA